MYKNTFYQDYSFKIDILSLTFPPPDIFIQVVYAVKEYACTAIDVIGRRTRLAFLNVMAAEEALPRIVEIMAKELGWSKAKQQVRKIILDTFRCHNPLLRHHPKSQHPLVVKCLSVYPYLSLTAYRHFTDTLLNATTEKCAGCSMQQDPPARTMVLVLSADGNNMRQLFTFVVSCCIEHS